MPIEISLPFDPNKMEKAIRYWIDLLVKEDYTEAYNLTEHDPYYKWTPTLIEHYINGYGLPYEKGETVYKVTDWRKVDNENRNPMNILLFEEPNPSDNEMFKRIGVVHYELPMNNERSDLTVIFSILQASDYLTLELNDIHVL